VGMADWRYEVEVDGEVDFTEADSPILVGEEFPTTRWGIVRVLRTTPAQLEGLTERLICERVD